MKKIIRQVYHHPLFGKIFHTLVNQLCSELADCETVLDIGCGNSSPLQYCKNIKYSLGVEPFHKYLQQSKAKGIHDRYLQAKIENLSFSKNEFDAVIMIEVLEHLPEKKALEILKKAEKWARKKVIVSSPNGYLPQKAVDNNLLQKHLSGWDHFKLKKLGYESHGLAGLKILRTEVENESMGDDLTTSIKYRPKIFWFLVATLSQIVTYYLPKLAFELFSVKRIQQ